MKAIIIGAGIGGLSTAIAVRDALFPFVPAGMMEKQLKYLNNVKLEGLL